MTEAASTNASTVLPGTTAAELRASSAPAPQPVGEPADQRGRNDLGPDPGGKEQRDLRCVEAAAREPYRPERRLDADDEKARGVKRAEARTDGCCWPQ